MLLLNDLICFFKFWIILRKGFCHAQNPLRQLDQQICGMGIYIVIPKLNLGVVVHFMESMVYDITNMGRQTKNTACSLTADRTHHKRNRTRIMQSSQCACFKAQKLIMELSLLWCELRFYGRGVTDAEILNITTACSIDHSAEAMQRLHI